jgi:endonuclease YncB( thermonuclease family)
VAAVSVHVVDIDDVHRIVGACVHYRLCDTVDTTAIGQALVDANIAAYRYRYPAVDIVAVNYQYQPTPASAGETARSLSRWLYNTCGQSGWHGSDSHILASRIAFAMLDQIPGWSDS